MIFFSAGKIKNKVCKNCISHYSSLEVTCH
jgi:hypothetical protein